MTWGAARKYLPLEGYRFLALAFLAHRGTQGASKGDVLWETRANHSMTTRTLQGLAQEGLVTVDGDAKGGFAIRITDEGARFLDQNGPFLLRTFGRALQGHFRYGRRPAWLPDVGPP